MAEETNQGGSDKGIGEGNLREERGAPPYADRAYAGESEPAGGQGPNQSSGDAGGANVSTQGGGSGSDKQGGNTGGSGSG